MIVSHEVIYYMFVCLEFLSHSNLFHSFGYVTIAGEGLQILTTYARHLWPLSSEGSLASHTYCDTGHPFMMVISKDPRHSPPMLSVWQWRRHYLFLRHRSRGWDSNTQSSAARRTLQPTALLRYCYLNMQHYLCKESIL